MKVQKYEISRTIDKLKSIVQKNDQFPALGGVLVKDGYLIASNTEMTMQLKLEASKGSCFIIPMKAFDVIKNLPDGEVDIDTEGENIVVIKTKAIKNKYQSYPPEDFSFDITENPDAPGVVINGKSLMEAIGHVIYAAARQCFKVYQSYIGLRSRYDSLKAAIDILRDQNTGFLQTIKEIERLYETASKEQGITAKYSTEWKEFERYADALPQEAWIQ